MTDKTRRPPSETTLRARALTRLIRIDAEIARQAAARRASAAKWDAKYNVLRDQRIAALEAAGEIPGYSRDKGPVVTIATNAEPSE